ncbi:hypothetical protein LPB138_10560 [Urechidicola croceus]|uniref:DUF3784 domain-containing protein n=2 Tax=Urechidicola croceus TaxID=1850246 RepID=A0A1D8P955_9FLAO|nr:hypothetical protein LPB138_10560 [Urechidicola croceus]
MLAVALIFIIIGVLIKYGKMYFLIAGYNTMSTEDQKKYDIEGIATLFFRVMIGMALVLIVGFLISKQLEIPKIENISIIVAIGIGLPYLLIKSNSKKFKKNSK